MSTKQELRIEAARLKDRLARVCDERDWYMRELDVARATIARLEAKDKTAEPVSLILADGTRITFDAVVTR